MPVDRIFVTADTADAEAKLGALAEKAKVTGDEIGKAGTTGGSKLGDAIDSGSSRASKALHSLTSVIDNAIGTNLSSVVDKAGAKFDALSTKGQKFGSIMSHLGGATIGAGLAGFAAAAYEGVKGATALQQQMEMIHTQAGASQAEVAKMTQSVMAIAPSVATGPQALAEAMYHVESTGFRGAKALNVLRTAAEGAKVGNANLTDVTNALDAAVVSHIKGVQNYSQAMGQLNSTVGAGDMTMQNLADAMSTGITGTAKTFGLTIGQLGGALATFGDNNIRGSAAATRLRQAIVMMGAPSATAAKALAAISLSQTQLADDMRSGGLIKAMEDLKAHLDASGASASQQALILARAFGGGRTSSGILLLMNQLDRLKQKTGDVASGARNFSKDWQATTHTLQYQFDQLRATVQQLADKFGYWLIPKLKETAHDVADVVGWFQRNKGAAQALGITIETVLGAAVATFVLGKAASFIGALSNMGKNLGALAARMSATKATIGADDATIVGTNREVQLSFDGMGSAATAASAKVDAAMGTEAGAVVAADTTIETANAEAAASFTAALGPLAIYTAAVYGLARAYEAVSNAENAATISRGTHNISLANQGQADIRSRNAVGLASVIKQMEAENLGKGHPGGYGPRGFIPAVPTSDAQKNLDELIAAYQAQLTKLGGGVGMRGLTHPQEIIAEREAAQAAFKAWTAAASKSGKKQKLTKPESAALAAYLANPSGTSNSSSSAQNTLQQEGLSLLQQLQGAEAAGTPTALRRVAVGATAEKLQLLVSELNATHKSGMQSLAQQLVAAHERALAGLNTALESQQEVALADQTTILTSQLTDMTTLLTNRSTNRAQIITDKGQAVADKLGERGLYGLNLIAQQMQVHLDKMTARWDTTIGKDQERVDRVTRQQDKLVNQAQKRVDEAATGSALAQARAQAQLKEAQAHEQYVIAHANKILAEAQNNSSYSKAKLQELIAIETAKATSQYAGSGLHVSITGINPTDAQAVASAVGWKLRTHMKV